jgi:hypothetical protein
MIVDPKSEHLRTGLNARNDNLRCLDDIQKGENRLLRFGAHDWVRLAPLECR